MKFTLILLILVYYLIFCIIPDITCVRSKYLIKINDENWLDILEGEWMINFFSKASWCPACKEMERPWNAFADWSNLKNKKIKVAQVDVSENPGLSGRFLVTALPTIYHVKDGVFRLYNGPKDKEDFVKFVKQKQWSTVESMPSWCHPNSFQMSCVAALFKFSMQARDFHNHMVDNKGLPSFLSFGMFGAATLVLGCILGFFMVLIIDRFVPSGKSNKKKGAQSSGAQNNVKNGGQNNSGSSKHDNKKGSNVSNGSTKNGSVPHNDTKNNTSTSNNITNNGESPRQTKAENGKDKKAMVANGSSKKKD